MQDDTVRLQKFLSERGIASRRHAAELIAAGRVTVNGKVCTQAGHRIEPTSDVIAFDGTQIDPSVAPSRTIVLNKPRGYICSASAKDGKTVFALLRGVPERVVPVGRLDKNSEGLLVLSNDGALVHEATHPRFEHAKTYRVTVSGHVDDGVVEALNEPMVIDGYKTRPAEVHIVKPAPQAGRVVLEFKLYEGRNRQIRKMCEQAGLKVHRLMRVAIGSLVLGGLPPGKWRDLSADECQSLRATTAEPPP